MHILKGTTALVLVARWSQQPSVIFLPNHKTGKLHPLQIDGGGNWRMA